MQIQGSTKKLSNPFKSYILSNIFSKALSYVTCDVKRALRWTLSFLLDLTSFPNLFLFVGRLKNLQHIHQQGLITRINKPNLACSLTDALSFPLLKYLLYFFSFDFVNQRYNQTTRVISDEEIVKHLLWPLLFEIHMPKHLRKAKQISKLRLLIFQIKMCFCYGNRQSKQFFSP